MSKIKSQSLNPRTLTGTLNLGNEGSTTSFHPLSTVVLPGYVTREELDEVIAGDVDLESYLTSEEARLLYQASQMKGQPDGYVPLNASGKVPGKYLNLSGMEIVGTYGSQQLPDPDFSVGDEGRVFHPGMAFICNTDHSFDAELPGIESMSGDLALIIADSSNDLSYNHIPVASQVLAKDVVVDDDRDFVKPNPGHTTVAGDTIQDLQDQIVDLGDGYLPLSGGLDHKMTDDLYMGKNQIQGVADPVYTEDAANKKYVDAHLGWDGGTVNTTITLNSPERDINVTTGQSAGVLKYNGTDKFRWGSGQNFSDQPLSMESNKITALSNPTSTQDAATKGYVDGKVSDVGIGDYVSKTTTSSQTMKGALTHNGHLYLNMESTNSNGVQTKAMVDKTIAAIPNPVEVGTQTSPPSRPKGDLYLTSNGKLYVYI
ncbi:MAG: hypothetical protein HOG43_07150 [Flavobacteriales bacterium]|jgi:hypothetical protein|nr:hypothetical protein [Flavobacteriales bacterium]